MSSNFLKIKIHNCDNLFYLAKFSLDYLIIGIDIPSRLTPASLEKNKEN